MNVSSLLGRGLRRMRQTYSTRLRQSSPVLRRPADSTIDDDLQLAKDRHFPRIRAAIHAQDLQAFKSADAAYWAEVVDILRPGTWYPKPLPPLNPPKPTVPRLGGLVFRKP